MMLKALENLLERNLLKSFKNGKDLYVEDRFQNKLKNLLQEHFQNFLPDEEVFIDVHLGRDGTGLEMWVNFKDKEEETIAFKVKAGCPPDTLAPTATETKEIDEHIILSVFFESGMTFKRKFKTFAQYQAFKDATKYHAEEVISMIHEGKGLYREWDGEWDIFEVDSEEPLKRLSRFLKSQFGVEDKNLSYYYVCSDPERLVRLITDFFAAVYPRAIVNVFFLPSRENEFFIHLDVTGEVKFTRAIDFHKKRKV